MEAQTVSIHGHDVSYRGGGSGPVVVLIHGMAGSSVTWEPVLDDLTRRYTVIAPDLPGHGESDKPRGDYSLGAHASSIRDLLMALGHERATVVGQSFGGGVAMQLAYQHPERCERLVLVASGGLGQEVALLLRALTLPGAEHLMPIACNGRIRDAGTAVTGLLDRIGLRPVPAVAEMWRSYASLSDGSTREAFQHTLRSVVDMHGQRVSATDKLYLAAAVPTLIVWGDRDPIIPLQHGIDAHEMIAGSRFEVFEGAGHFPHCEQPDRFVEVLVDFVDSTSPMAKSELTDQI
ncbi:MAG: alpha/beta fold hydrolase [Acidimicrobiia bacterium]